jgi:uncharacterized integral membrane protein
MRRDDDPGREDPGDQREERRAPEPPRSSVGPRQVLIGLLVVVLIAFAIANWNPVDVNFLLFETRARVFTVVAVAGALGFAAGYLAGRPNRGERKRLRRGDG